jgi:hypothetical protein
MWRRVIAGGRERSQVEGREHRWRGAIADRGQRSQVDSEGSDHRLRTSIASEGYSWQLAGSDVGGRHCFPSMPSLGATTPFGTIRCRRAMRCRRSPSALGTILPLVMMTAIQCDLVTGSQSFQFRHLISHSERCTTFNSFSNRHFLLVSGLSCVVKEQCFKSSIGRRDVDSAWSPPPPLMQSWNSWTVSA